MAWQLAIGAHLFSGTQEHLLPRTAGHWSAVCSQDSLPIVLQELKARHRRIGDVRGMGLFIGVELMKDGHGLEPAPEATAWVFERCKELGLLIGKGGPYNNVLRIKPPICVTRADIEFLVGCLARALQEEQEMEEQGRMVVCAFRVHCIGWVKWLLPLQWIHLGVEVRAVIMPHGCVPLQV